MKSIRQFVMAAGHHRTGFFVRSVGHFVIDSPEPSKHANFGEIFWCVAGCGYFTAANGREIPLRSGWLWYYPPGSFQRFRPGKPYFDYRWLALEGRAAGELFAALGIRAGANQSGLCPEEEFARVELNLHESTQQSQMRALSAAFSILTRVAAPELEAPPGVERARQLIAENYGEVCLNVTRIADLLNIHRVTLSRSFTAAYGMAPGDYLNSVRLKAGMRLLATTDLPIKEVALRCGFATAGYFAKAIRKLTGQTPCEFRSGIAPRHGGRTGVK